MRPWLATLVIAACGDNAGSTLVAPAWDKALPSARVMGTRRGLTPVRGIVHLHSPYSHDACDGQPRDASGALDESCLTSLRGALCTTRIDYAALTDHHDTMADEELPALFAMRGDDQPVFRGAEQIASRIACDDGHEVLVTVGAENALMPIFLDRHVAGTASERHATYMAADAAAAAAFRDAGGLVWIPHTESQPLDRLRALQPDGLEIYNLHANLDPAIRRDHLGLDPRGAIDAAAEFSDSGPRTPEPDLALLAFLSPNQPALDTWHALLADGHRVAVTAGSDAHENVLPLPLADGERGDSYRRVLRWFGNIALVEDPRDIAQIEGALADGRTFVVFELLGTPEGFDVRAVTPIGTTIELGGTVPPGTGAQLVIDVPRVRDLDLALPAPTIRVNVYWIDPAGPVLRVASGDGITTGDGQVRAHIGAPGAYRVEVTIVPSHLGPYLGDLGPAYAEAELPWIYTSPFYVE